MTARLDAATLTRAAENCSWVRLMLLLNQPEFSAVLDRVVEELTS